MAGPIWPIRPSRPSTSPAPWSVTVQDADAGDTTTLVETLTTAAVHLETVRPDADVVREVVADKGYHSNRTLSEFADVGVRTYISEPDRGRRQWTGKAAAQAAVYEPPTYSGRARQRGERLERPFAYETGMRRSARPSQHPEAARRASCVS